MDTDTTATRPGLFARFADRLARLFSRLPPAPPCPECGSPRTRRTSARSTGCLRANGRAVYARNFACKDCKARWSRLYFHPLEDD